MGRLPVVSVAPFVVQARESNDGMDVIEDQIQLGARLACNLSHGPIGTRRDHADASRMRL